MFIVIHEGGWITKSDNQVIYYCHEIRGWGKGCYLLVVAVVVGFPQNYLLKQMLRVQCIHKERVCVAQPVFLKVLTGISLNMQ